MKHRIKALRSLRWNYTWRALLDWLVGAPEVRCDTCEGAGQVCKNFGLYSSGRPEVVDCPRCMGVGRNPGLKLGWERIRDEPEAVIAEQEATAEGVFV